MSSEIELLVGDRQDGESDKAAVACNDYLRMGVGRSLRKLIRTYTEDSPTEPPTKYLRTLKGWSTRFGWVERAATFDAGWEENKTEARRRIMESGLALDYKRVETLQRLAVLLLGELSEEDEEGSLYKLWLPDVKQIGSGDFAERVDIVRFNSSLLTQIRGVLDDLAKETGGRASRVTAQSLEIDVTKLADDQLRRIANGEDPLVVIATTAPGESGAGETASDEDDDADLDA